MLTLNLTPVFKARGIENPFTYLVKNGFNRHTAHNLVSNKRTTFRSVDVDKLCSLLHCTPNNLFLWTPDKNNPLPDTHPLTSLRKSTSDLNWQNTIKTVPFDELEHIVNTINSTRKEKQPTQS